MSNPEEYDAVILAQAFRRLGSRVTIVERNATLIHREDLDVTPSVGELFRDEGIEVSTRTTLTRVEGVSGESVRLHGTRGGAKVVIEGTHLLAAGGRTPNTDGIGLERAGIEIDPRAMLGSMSGSRQRRQACGRSEIARAARTSRTSPTTTSESYTTTSPAGAASQPGGRCRSVCSPTPN